MIFRLISPRVHGFIDYAVAVLLFLAPTLFGFENQTATTLSYVFGVAHTAVSLLTKYPLGVVKAIPFRIHGYIELTAAFVLLASPSIFGFTVDTAARNFFMISAIALLGVIALTRYDHALAPGEDKVVGTSPTRSPLGTTNDQPLNPMY